MFFIQCIQISNLLLCEMQLLLTSYRFTSHGQHHIQLDDITSDELRHLRLIEAANLLDQGEFSSTVSDALTYVLI